MSEEPEPTKKQILLKKIGLIAGLAGLLLLIGMSTYAYRIYREVHETAEDMYKPIKNVEKKRKKTININNKDSFSVLLLGIDTDKGRTRKDTGRSDTMILATVNPEMHLATMLSIPRDTYTEISGWGKQDKINHAYAFGGVSMSINTVQDMLQVPVDYYIKVDMVGLQNIVEAVGGVEVDNAKSFDSMKKHYGKGWNHLTKDNVMGYVRMRYEDPDGDYGRQRRQQQVIQGVAEKMKNMKTLTNYQAILKVFSKNVETNMKFSEMMAIMLKDRQEINKFQNLQVRGEGMMLDGVSYQKVSETEIFKYRRMLIAQLGVNN